ncbi:protein HEG homolog 1 isoform X2 [Hyalella azteca]|uniref:Protein HEG homolog 1 isoform X2 n=1 Tax=Hyalella azteca TaxID=294128 RepID=A0A979FR26_HYAAZ|nr:protein HEG homolog 1 isoform X2 [Hyalella azteca]
MTPNHQNTKTIIKMSLLAVFVLLLLVEKSEVVSANSVPSSTNFKYRPQPPPFSPSLERLIQDLKSNKISGKENSSLPSFEGSDRKAIDPPSKIFLDSIRKKPAPQNAADKGKLTRLSNSASIVNHSESPATREQQPIATTQPSIAGDSSSNSKASLNGDNVSTQRSVFVFDNPFDSERENCPPPLEPGHLRWRKGNNFVTASLPHLASESCRPPVKCSFSTTVHRRVFVQDGDTLQVVLQITDEPPDLTPHLTQPTATKNEQFISPLVYESVSTKSSSEPKSQQPLQRLTPSDEEHESLKSMTTVLMPTMTPSTITSSFNYNKTDTRSSVHYSLKKEALPQDKADEEETTDELKNEISGASKQKAALALLSQANKAKAAMPDGKPSKLLTRLQPVTSEEKSGRRDEPLGVSAPSFSKISAPSHKQTPGLEPSAPSLQSAPSPNKNSGALANETSPDTRTPVRLQTVAASSESLIRRQKRAPQILMTHTESDDKIADAANSQMALPRISSLTLWKVSVSEWVSCSTREGGQVAQSGPEGIATLTPHDLQPGTTYFIGRSSWSSSECFKLQVTVRSAECGEGSLCSGKGTCHANSSMEHFQCACCPDYMGSHCEELDACHSQPCLNDGICVDIQEGHDGNTFQCLCPYGYRGRVCEHPSNLCESAPCKNGGSCEGNHSVYSCSCSPGWSGPQCSQPVPTLAAATLDQLQQQDRFYLKPHPDYGNQPEQEPDFERPTPTQSSQADEEQQSVSLHPEIPSSETFESSHDSEEETESCEARPCVHGVCIDTPTQSFRCFCQPGFGGNRCEFEYDECSSNPCYNGGTCIDHIGTYQCLCSQGYYGNRCQAKVDMCRPDPCPQSRVCLDKGNSYSCECLAGLPEDDCGPHTKVCDSNPCQNGGTCWSMAETWSFFCACRPGFTGGMCEELQVLETVGSMGTLDPPLLHDDQPAPPLSTLPFGDVHNVYVAATVLSCALLIFAVVVGACHCRVNRTYRKCLVAMPCAGRDQTPCSLRRARHNNLLEKARRERNSVLRLDADCDGSSLPMTSPGASSADNIFYNMDMCDNQELPLIK